MKPDNKLDHDIQAAIDEAQASPPDIIRCCPGSYCQFYNVCHQCWKNVPSPVTYDYSKSIWAQEDFMVNRDYPNEFGSPRTMRQKRLDAERKKL